MRRQEEQFNTPEQVTEYLRIALEVVDELDVPDDLRVACFTQAATLISGKQLFFEQPQAVNFDLSKLRH